MDFMKKGNSTSQPFLLDETNYGYWKIHMSVFIKSLGMEVWKSIVTRWSIPTTIVAGKTMVKEKSKWSSKEREMTLSNYKGLNAIQFDVDARQFELIAIT